MFGGCSVIYNRPALRVGLRLRRREKLIFSSEKINLYFPQGKLEVNKGAQSERELEKFRRCKPYLFQRLGVENADRSAFSAGGNLSKAYRALAIAIVRDCLRCKPPPVGNFTSEISCHGLLIFSARKNLITFRLTLPGQSKSQEVENPCSKGN